jgi:hypothetical protein
MNSLFSKVAILDDFEVTLEVNDIQRGSRSFVTIKSSISWAELQNQLAATFNVYPGSLHAQYRLSNEAKGSLPLDLISKQHLNTLITFLRPLIVPAILANGQRSTRKKKAVTVQIFNKGETAQSGEGNRKVSSSSIACRIAMLISVLMDRTLQEVRNRRRVLVVVPLKSLGVKRITFMRRKSKPGQPS